MRATANLDEIARRPESRAVERPTTSREIFEPERALRKRSSSAKLATNAAAPRQPDTLPPAAPLVPPIYTGFPAIPDNFTAIPPDTMGAVGPRHVVTMLNTQVSIHSRDGVVRSGYPISLNAFWSALGSFSGSGSTFDPRIYYDASADRWIAVSDSAGELPSSALLIATSQTGDPGGIWNFYRIPVGAANLWGDFPTLGVNGKWIVVSMNMFQIQRNQNYVNTNVYVFSKADLYKNADSDGKNGSSGTYTVFTDNQGEFAGVIDLDDSLPDTMYLLQAYATDFAPVANQGAIRISKITGAVGAEKFAPGNVGFVNIADPWADSGPGNGDFAQQLGTTARVDSGDGRLVNCVLRNGSIWCAHTVYVPYPQPKRASAQWFQIDPAGPSLIQRGRVDDPTNAYTYAYPSIAVNKKGDALIAYTRFSAGEYPTAEFSYRQASDPPNTMQPDTVFKQGESSYVANGSRSGSNRWGDYSISVVDPADDTTFWTLQEYAATPPGTRNGAFGTWWARVLAPSSGLHCTYTVDAAGRAFDATGGTGTATVNAGEGCLWQAASNTSWLSVSGGSPGSGGGTVQFNVAPGGNAVLPRSGTITIAGQTITVTQSAPSPNLPTFTQQGVVNAASYQGGGVAPGELITLFGSTLGPASLQKPLVSTLGIVDSFAGGTRVLFDGVAAPMIYAISGQISAVVPFSLQGRSSTQVQVEFLGIRSAAVTVPVVAAAPAIFTSDASGKGQGAILNQDYTVNGASNAAAKGSIISIYMTGAGAMQSPVTDGELAKDALSIAQPVMLSIGGVAVTPLYAGAAPGIVQGVVQINAAIPAGVASGNVPVEVTIGGVTSPTGVTVAVR
ncbi:MAG TPA: BACON domain-containing carbohydrate-binding protein [Candidatus Solibacter sp.]|nr:BACON domain-containing carbohydrate-binding protein [Candidatus Solibacter sp.]